MIEVLSPTPPVECLSAFGLGMSEKSRMLPELSIASVSACCSVLVHAVEVDGHKQRADLIVGNATAGYAGDEELDLFTR